MLMQIAIVYVLIGLVVWAMLDAMDRVFFGKREYQKLYYLVLITLFWPVIFKHT